MVWRLQGSNRLSRPALAVLREDLGYLPAGALDDRPVEVNELPAEGAGQSLASSFNIGAFNLGNAIGAWAGGMVIDHGPDLALVPMTAALFPLLAIATALVAVRSSRQMASAAAQGSVS